LPPADEAVVKKTTSLLTAATAVAGDAKQPLPQRVNALGLLAHVSWDVARPALTDMLTGGSAKEIRLAAVRTLGAHAQAEVAPILLKPWKSYTPALRVAVTETLLRRTDWTKSLLKEVESGAIKPGDIDAVSRKRLLAHKTPELRVQAEKLLQNTLPAARQKVLAEYQAALKLKGDPARGKVVFEKNCATCHRVGGVGVNVAPDISDSERTKTPEAFLADILNPNQAIDNNYVNYLVVTKSGKVLNGIIATETASSITLRRASNETDVVLRQDIDDISSTGVSLMPEGLEQSVTVAEMADLLAFLKNWRYLDGSVPLEK
jgi:putative heme-binding domain-containing protein